MFLRNFPTTFGNYSVASDGLLRINDPTSILIPGKNNGVMLECGRTSGSQPFYFRSIMIGSPGKNLR